MSRDVGAFLSVYAMRISGQISWSVTVLNGMVIFVCRHLKEFMDLQMFGIKVVEDLAVSWHVIIA